MSLNTKESFSFWSFAKDFLSAAKAVRDPTINLDHGKKFELLFVAYYLLGHSIELSFKSYLAAKGYPVTELKSRKYGHNLKALLTEARRRKLGREVKLSKKQEKAIILFSAAYSSKNFEYLKYGEYRLPDYKYLFDTAQFILEGLAYYSSNSPFNKAIQRKTQ